MRDILSLIVALASFCFVAFIKWPKFVARVREIRSQSSPPPPPRAGPQSDSIPKAHDQAEAKVLREARVSFMEAMLMGV
jgi:hypothetical protein